MFYNQFARSQSAVAIRIAKFARSPKTFRLNRPPAIFALVIQSSRDHGSLDARIERGAVEREQATLGSLLCRFGSVFARA